MSQEKAKWEQFEIIVADIQKQLAPSAVVRHDHWVIGKSGRRRKLDITVSETIGVYPIFIVFDCKHHKRKVKIKDVEAFAGQLEDVKASLGVMVSHSGFDAGAQAIASQRNIILQTYRAAEATDWNQLVGEEAWVFLTNVEIENVQVFVVLGTQSFEISFNILVFNQDKEVVGNLKDLFWKVWKMPESPKIIGDIKFQIKANESPLFIHNANEFFQVSEFMVDAKLTAKKYAVNLRLSEGNILEDFKTGKPVYREVSSNGFDWAEILRTQSGIEMSLEEYEQTLRTSSFLADISNSQKYLRVVINDKK